MLSLTWRGSRLSGHGVPGGILKALITLTVVAAVMAIGAVPALGDVEQFVPHAVTPNHASGAVEPLTEYEAGGVTCSAAYSAPIEAWHDTFSIGNCLNGWPGAVDEWNYPGSNGTYWDGGSWGGNYGWNCGYIQTTYAVQTGGTTTTKCPAGYETPESDYIAPCSGCDQANLYIWSNEPPGKGTDGVAVPNRHACWEYANLSPWSSGGGPVNAVRELTVRPSNERVRLRYQTRYEYNGKKWYMIHDPVYGAGDGNWVFISSECELEKPSPNG